MSYEIVAIYAIQEGRQLEICSRIWKKKKSGDLLPWVDDQQ